jgi:hypothetical protein
VAIHSAVEDEIKKKRQELALFLNEKKDLDRPDVEIVEPSASMPSSADAVAATAKTGSGTAKPKPKAAQGSGKSGDAKAAHGTAKAKVVQGTGNAGDAKAKAAHGTAKAKVVQGTGNTGDAKAKAAQGPAKVGQSKTAHGPAKAKAAHDPAKASHDPAKAKAAQGTGNTGDAKAKASQVPGNTGDAKAKAAQGTAKAKAPQVTAKAKEIAGTAVLLEDDDYDEDPTPPAKRIRREDSEGLPVVKIVLKEGASFEEFTKLWVDNILLTPKTYNPLYFGFSQAVKHMVDDGTQNAQIDAARTYLLSLAPMNNNAEFIDEQARKLIAM